MDPPSRQSNIGNQAQEDDLSLFEHDSLGEIHSMTSKVESAKNGPERFGTSTKEMGSLVVNEQGDLQYLGEIRQVFRGVSH
jgi:hypothetical protein